MTFHTSSEGHSLLSTAAVLLLLQQPELAGYRLQAAVLFIIATVVRLQQLVQVAGVWLQQQQQPGKSLALVMLVMTMWMVS
jgi:hypothetical protein